MLWRIFSITVCSQLLSEDLDLVVGLFDLGLVVLVLLLVLGDLGHCLTLVLVHGYVHLLNLVGQLLTALHPLVLVFFKARAYLLDLLLLDLQGGTLLLVLSVQVELMVLDLAVLVLQFGIFLLKKFHLVLFEIDLFLELSDFVLVHVCLMGEVDFLLLKLSENLLDVVKFILFYLKVCLSLVSQLHVVSLESFKLLVDSGFFFSFDETLVLIFRYSSSHVGIKLLFFEM